MALNTEVLDREVSRLRAFEGVEPVTLDRARLAEVRAAVGAARRALDAVSATVAAEVARRSDPSLGANGLARQEGHSSPVESIAREWGLGHGEAGRLIDVGKSLQPLAVPATPPRPDHQGNPQSAAGDGSDRDNNLVPGLNDPAGGEAGAPQQSRFPRVAQALTDGELTAAAAAEITRTLEVAAKAEGSAGPSSTTPTRAGSMTPYAQGVGRLERQLVARAKKLSLSELRRACRQLRAHRAPQDLEQLERHQRAERFIAFTEDADGMTTISGRLDPTAAAPLRAWVDAHVRQGFQARHGLPHGVDDRTPGQMRADAIADLAKHGLGCEEPTMGVKATVVVRVAQSDLNAGTGVAECDTTSGPISISTLRLLAVDAEILPVVLGGASEPLDLGRSRRQFSRAQRIALAERDGGCAWCHAPVSYCDAHHVKWWARDRGTSDLDNGVLLCTACHHRIHDTGWEISTTPTRVWLIPPASHDPERRPILGGRAALTLDHGAPTGSDQGPPGSDTMPTSPGSDARPAPSSSAADRPRN
ncbi:DUF222 domain-containing protein [Demequina globuliformis]|uniref:DUF222 domain-containing protein n=1 Tax=Demequina globuliformis TaxID=676202 RepID=UPI0007840C22|nr:DUF222 domain-containing protein [Demequina globuliformis]